MADSQDVSTSNPWVILVAIEGFVYAGNVEKVPDGYRLTKSVNIRNWGTDNGLGQLAIHGPNEETQLDKVGDIFFPTHAVVSIINCIPSKKW